MKVKYIYSACLEIDCNGFKILTDPWFTEGIYDGSWFQFPKIDPFDFISKPDLIYISHIHPDHYDPIFLKKLFQKFGEIPVLIPELKPNYLEFKGKLDEINLTPTKFYQNSKVEIYIVENDTSSISDIDSAIIIKDIKSGHTLLNLNDCIYNSIHVEELKSIISQICEKLEILSLGYTGAGPYPQTYFDIKTEKDLLIFEANKKKNKFFDRYKKYINYFDANYNMPFAGEYVLGGKLTYLNNYRGVSDSYEVILFDEKAVVLKNGGIIDLDRNEILEKRISPYDDDSLKRRFKQICKEKMDYEKELHLEIEKINFLRLLRSAAIKASSKSEINHNYIFIFSITDQSNKICKRYLLEIEESKIREIETEEKINYEEYSEIIIDYRYLFGLLTTLYHWNNAEVGSQYFCKRFPYNNFKPSVQNYLNFFSIS